MFLLKFLVLILSLAIFWEDMQSRSVHWFLFPLLYTVLFIGGYYPGNKWAVALQHSLWNALFIFIQLGIATLYFSLKNRRVIRITNGMLGWGDILLLLSITGYFSFINYVLFYIASLVLVLLMWGVIRAVSQKKHQHIPLAGLQALLFGIVFTLAWFQPIITLNSDEWIINKLILQ